MELSSSENPMESVAPVSSRKLDVAESASIDKVALNNKVVSMRGLIKQVRVHTIHKLTRIIERLKKKKGTEQQKAKNMRKVQRLIDEIHYMKIIRRDNVAKYALGSTENFNEILKQPNVPVEKRILARMAGNRLLLERVERFRKEHPDWRALVEFLLTKNTAREYKKRKTKQPRGKARKTQPIKNNMGKSVKALTNIEATDLLVNTYLEGKLGSGSSELEGTINSNLRKNCVLSKTGSYHAKSNETKEKLSQKSNNVSKKKASLVASRKQKGKKDSDEESMEVEEGKQIEEDSDEKEDSLEKDSDCEENCAGSNLSAESESEEENVSQSTQETSLSKQNAKRKLKKKETNTISVKTKQKIPPKSVERGSVLVKKINLDDVDSKSSEVKIDKSIPDLLLTVSDSGSKPRQRVKDPFFAGSDDDDDDDDNTVDCPQPMNLENHIEDENIDEDDDNENNRRRSLNTRYETEKGKKAFMSTFVGSLRKKEEMPFKRNEDWKRIRQEERDKNRFGNRGRFPDRGRGRGVDRGASHTFGDRRGRSRGGITSFRGDRFSGGERGRFQRGGPTRRGGRGGHRGEARFTDSSDRNTFTAGKDRGGKSAFNNKAGGIRKPSSVKSGVPDGPVHPSWEASKKRKEEQSKIPAFQGKRITFDD